MKKQKKSRVFGMFRMLGLAGLLATSGLAIYFPTGRSTVNPESGIELGKIHKTKWFDQVDSPPCTFVTPAGRFVIGTESINGGMRWTVWDATDGFINPKKLYESVRDESFTQPNGDEAYWICSGSYITPDGTWIASIHVESCYGTNSCLQPYYKNPWPLQRVGIASSKDQGRTWHYNGDILTSQDVGLDVGWWVNCGIGNQRMYIDKGDGYAYIITNHYWIRQDYLAYGKIHLWCRDSSHIIARAPLSGGLMPGTWKKWDGKDWNEPGLGGADYKFMPDTASGNIFYSTYFKKPCGIYAFWDKAKREYSFNFLVFNNLANNPGDYSMASMGKVWDGSWYPTPIDLNYQNPAMTGDEFLLFSSECKEKSGHYRKIKVAGLAKPIKQPLDEPPRIALNKD